MKPIDISGMRYGRLMAVRRASADEIPESDKRRNYYACLCECGKQKIIRAAHLRSGRIVSCGCYHREHSYKKHGLTGTPEYKTWSQMIRRCRDPKSIHYLAYGGRGIKVCERWLTSVANFVADMGPRPSLKHTIDRYPNNDGNYEPGNCRWATYDEQARNKSTNHYLEFNGQRLTVEDWAVQIGIQVATLSNRLHSGWSVERALTAPVRHWPQQIGESR